ncbi:hypothetical protein M408DRAFT_328353 [Serendipita vermifera MAFF 305830]|uniref:Uncharacterized protein n=1 Tax=Serendipita vermifera MAFF 305830 TaxID=933852 RepID=A0A0C2XMZ2_SERVB|nr:hypothetical protein M408DRAFT_328353 [Serendipita vermifera MAFF 305830]
MPTYLLPEYEKRDDTTPKIKAWAEQRVQWVNQWNVSMEIFSETHIREYKCNRYPHFD